MTNAYHINRLCTQLYGTLRKNHQTRSHVDEHMTHMTKVIVQALVHALVLSRIKYCSSLIIGSAEYQPEKLQRVQNMTCRVIYKMRKFNHVRDHHKALHWLKIRDRMTYKIAMLGYKCKHNITPEYLQELLPSRQHTKAFISFKMDFMGPSFCQNTLVKNLSFSSTDPRTWNSLPA